MASVTEPGTLRVYAVTPEGQKVGPVYQARNGGPISAGGSPDGVLANKTADKWAYMPKSNVVLSGGWKVFATIELDAADGIDASDCYVDIPITIKGAGIKHLNASDLGFSTDYPASTPAAIELPLGAGYTIPNGQLVKIGGDKAAISIEDDTA